MAVVTRAQLKTRAEQLFDDIPSMALLSGTEERIASTSLPATEVRIGAATYTQESHKIALVTVDVVGWVVVQSIARLESDADVNAAIEACYNWQDTIADYFMGRPRLERSDTGVAVGIGALSFSQPDVTPYKESAGGGFAAFSVTIPVTIRRFSS